MTSTEDQLSAEDVASCLEEWGRTCPPSRFMVYGVLDDPAGGYDGGVLAWGLAFDDHVLVDTERTMAGGTFTSMDRMRRILFRGDRDIRVLWVDPEPEH